MNEGDNLHFFEKLETPQEEEENVAAQGSYFSSIMSQIFRSDSSAQVNEAQPVETVVEPVKEPLERKESEESRTSEESGFHRSFDKITGLLKTKPTNPKLKNYNDSNFKQYWMPDSTGRECYQCEERFTTFRRRHHCRLCGQIFCAKCCNSHIDGASLGYMGELRLCDWCAKKVERLSEDIKQDPNQRKDSHLPANRKVSFDKSTSQKNMDSVKTVSNGAIWSICPKDTGISESRHTPPNQSRRESIAGPSNTPAILSVQELCANSSMMQDSNINAMINDEEESGPDWFRSMNPGMDGVINNEASDSADVFAYANMAGTITNEFTEMMEARAADMTDRKITFPSLSLDETALNAAKEEQRDNLEELFNRNTERMLDEVLKREYIREEIWKNLLIKTALEVASSVVVNVPAGDNMSIGEYVHVKKVVSADPGMEIVWGAVCSKSLLSDIPYTEEAAVPESSVGLTSESIMIVSGSIEYERVSNKLSSIEPVIVQEEKFLEKQIDRICSKRASLILVEGGVSRIAAQLLNKRGIKVAVNVKTSTLNRISRCTGADIVSNSDAQLVEQNLGCCPEFEQRLVTQQDGTTKTMMVFADCQKELGCTILVNGDDEKELVSVKRVLKFLVTIMYSNIMEKAYLNAFNTNIARRQSDCIVCEQRRAIIYTTGERTPFEKALATATLTSSPVVEFEPPFLETIEGKQCTLMTYFKQPLYKLPKDDEMEAIKLGKDENVPDVEKKPVPILEKRFVIANCNRGTIVETLARCFRLYAGVNFKRRANQMIEFRKKTFVEKPTFRPKDVLDPRVHQTLAVLFGSFSRKSPNAPYFCVRPWVVRMKYYQDHDMTLGEFLSKYCFNRSYECPSSNCEVSMLDHSRKLVYGRVCVEISTQTVNESENSIDSDKSTIMTWRNCSKCNCSSQMVKCDRDIWHLSFAKYLEYLGNSCFTTDTTYPVLAQNQCSHCFFHEKLYFFAFENLVTTFKVIAIRPYSVQFSPIFCNVKVQKVKRKDLGEDVNRIANLALSVCEEGNKQLADLDEDLQLTSIFMKLAGAIKNTTALASESRMFAKQILAGDEEEIRSHDKLYRDVTDTFMKVREMAYTLISLWNENYQLIKKKPSDDANYETVPLQKIENPFPSYLHLSIKMQPRIGVVVRDIQDVKGTYKPDIGSIIAYALSAVDYTKKTVPEDNVSMESVNSTKEVPPDDGENLSSDQHLEVEFEDESASYYVKMFYAEKFRKLRELLIAEGEETFIRSLSISTFWTPQGGKSGSFFYRTQNNRFVVKQMSRFEIQSFLKFGPNYFDYLTTAATESKLTTLCKVYGVFRVGYKSKTTTLKVDILVMEYLFYDHNVSQVWDLKGSLRNRMASTGKSPNEMVLLDENFVKDLWNQQLYVLPHSKAALTQAISNDSHFLSSQSIMDYSLLVGVDDDNGELILGIVDYMRTYTLDKKLESWVKIVAIPGAHLPTILSPEMYCARFSEAIDSYFPVVPDQWTGLGSVRSY